MSFTKIASRIVMYIAGSFLIIAGLLKAHQLLTEPIIKEGFWESWAFFVIQIPLELGLGIWLLCGLFRKAAWLLSVLAYGAFIGITLHKGYIGEISCGCFGVVHVNPWITSSLIDAPIFVLLLIFYPRNEKLLPPPWPSAEHFFGVALPTFVILATIVPALIFGKVERNEVYTQNVPVIQHGPNYPPDANETAPDANQNQIEVLVKKEWAMLKHIDIADSLRTGVAIVLFYHYDCPTCRESIPIYEQYNKEYKGNNLQFAFIEMPPYGPEDENPVPADTTCLTGKLDTSQEWFIQTPLVVVIREALFINSWEGEAPTIEQILESIAQN